MPSTRLSGNYRPSVWWNPDAGVSPAEREWLEEKYPGWNRVFGRHWDVLTQNVRDGKLGETYPETLPVACTICQLPVVRAAGLLVGANTDAAPPRYVHEGRVYQFCSEPCKWIFAQRPDRFAGHKSITDRLWTGGIKPLNIGGLLAYMGLSEPEHGTDADNYAWAYGTAANGKH
jgi:toluene monooxygenase system protein A